MPPRPRILILNRSTEEYYLILDACCCQEKKCLLTLFLPASIFPVIFHVAEQYRGPKRTPVLVELQLTYPSSGTHTHGNVAGGAHPAISVECLSTDRLSIRWRERDCQIGDSLGGGFRRRLAGVVRDLGNFFFFWERTIWGLEDDIGAAAACSAAHWGRGGTGGRGGSPAQEEGRRRG